MTRQKFKPGPIPTLGQIRAHASWVWLYCAGSYPHGAQCHHSAPLALAIPIILWGYDASSDVLRQRARCTKCGSRGASLRLPSMGATNGIAEFPVGGGTNLASRD